MEEQEGDYDLVRQGDDLVKQYKKRPEITERGEIVQERTRNGLEEAETETPRKESVFDIMGRGASRLANAFNNKGKGSGKQVKREYSAPTFKVRGSSVKMFNTQIPDFDPLGGISGGKRRKKDAFDDILF